MLQTCPGRAGSGVLLWTPRSSLSHVPFPPFVELAAKFCDGKWTNWQIIAGAGCTEGCAQGVGDAAGCGRDASELGNAVETRDLGQTRHASCSGRASGCPRCLPWGFFTTSSLLCPLGWAPKPELPGGPGWVKRRLCIFSQGSGAPASQISTAPLRAGDSSPIAE